MKFTTKPFFVAAAMLTAVAPLAANAQDDKKPAAEKPAEEATAEKSTALRLLEVIDFKSTARAAADASFAPVMDQMKGQGLPDEAIVEMKAAADKFFTRTFEDPELNPELAKVYENTFTNEEMEELIVFYKTPVGQKTLQTMPQVMQESGMVGQKIAAKNQAEFQGEMQAIMTKYQPAPEATTPPTPAPAPAPAPAPCSGKDTCSKRVSPPGIPASRTSVIR